MWGNFGWEYVLVISVFWLNISFWIFIYIIYVKFWVWKYIFVILRMRFGDEEFGV